MGVDGDGNKRHSGRHIRRFHDKVVRPFRREWIVMPKHELLRGGLYPGRPFNPLRVPAACNAGELPKCVVTTAADFAANITRFIASRSNAAVI